MDIAVTRPARRALDGLQYLRAAAAMLVVLFHSGVQIYQNTGEMPAVGLYRIGERGVELFFVLSGFIIYYTHAQDPHTWAAVARYLRKRLMRIIPPAFVVATGWALVFVAAERIGLKLSAEPTSLAKWASSALVVPMLDTPSPIVIWSLKHELAFYVLFLSAFLSVRFSVVLLAAWAILSLMLAPTGNFALEMLTSNYNVLFLAGAGAYFLHRRQVHSGAWLAVAGAIAFVVIANAHNGVSGHTSLLPVYLAAPSVAILLGVANMKARGFLGRALSFLGDASYSIYLVHFPALAVLYRFTSRLVHAPDLLFVVDAALAAGAGVAFYQFGERPLMKLISTPERPAQARAPARATV